MHEGIALFVAASRTGVGRRASFLVEGKLITPARHREDGIRAQELAQVHHVNLQVVFLDDQAWPHDVEQFLLRDHAVAPLNERMEQVESATAEFRWTPVDEDDARMWIHADSPRVKRHDAIGIGHG